jgi:hypothetical protein
MATILIVLWVFLTIGLLVWAAVSQSQLNYYSHGTAAIPGPDVPKCTGIVPMIVVSYNVRTMHAEGALGTDWSARKEDMAVALNTEAKADLYMFQEMTPDQQEYLAGKLGPDYEWFGDLRQDGTERNPLVYRKSIFTRENGDTVHFPDQENMDTKIYQRIYTWAIFHPNIAPTKRFLAICTHMYRKPQEKAQRAAAKILTAFLNTHPTLPVLLGADWNPSETYDVAAELVRTSASRLMRTTPTQSGSVGTHLPDDMRYAHAGSKFDGRRQFDGFVASKDGLTELYSTIVRYMRVSEKISGFLGNSDHDPVLTVWGL